jgi:hypothetical protein
MKRFNAWATKVFGSTCLGDCRRTSRLVKMLEEAARNPSGKVSAAFTRDCDREGAYDFLESPHSKQEVIAAKVFEHTTSHVTAGQRVLVPIDGSSLSLSDPNGAKGFGPIGSANREVRGVMVVNALAVTQEGVPLGLLDQIFWNRGEREEGLTNYERFKRNEQTPFEQKEPYKFIEAATSARDRLEAVNAKACFVIDRAADSRDILLSLDELTKDTQHIFVVRGGTDRKLCDDTKLQEKLDSQPRLGTYAVQISRKGNRPARNVKMEVHSAPVELRFAARPGRTEQSLKLVAVRVRETTQRKGKKRLEWILYTNAPVLTDAHALEIVQAYQARWRVEEFHRTWKQGGCNVEDAQLHSFQAITIWATILAAVAMRIERLKYLSRTTPDASAAIELSTLEIEAIKLNKQQRMLPRRTKLPEQPTIAEVTLWIAELGGYIGKRNGPPGSITISRGLERLGYLVEGMALARASLT